MFGIFNEIVATPHRYLVDRVGFKARVLFYCFENHVKGSESRTTTMYCLHKRIGTSDYLFGSVRDARLLMLYRLGVVQFASEIYSVRGRVDECRCGSRFSSLHLIDECEIFIRARSELKAVCNILPGESIFSIFDQRVYRIKLIEFVRAITETIFGIEI